MKVICLLFTFAIVSSEPGIKNNQRHAPYINRPKPPSNPPGYSRSADPQGSIVLRGEKPLGGPDRRPARNLDYQHNIYEGKNGQITAAGGALKLPGRDVELHFGVQGTWRFRRSPEPQGSIAVQRQALGGPDRRPAWNLDYQHNMYEHKNGHVSASGCAQKLPGREFEPHFGSQGTLRFRRSPEPQGSIAVQRQALGGPDRRPAWNLDYQHNMYEHKNGHVSASGCAQKLPGREFEPHFGSQGTLRFRRSPEPQGSIAVQRQALGGPDRRPAWNLDYQHNMYEHKNGHVSASGGAQKLPGREFEPHFGSQGTLRFRRSPEPQGSIAVQRQALGGPDRRPAWNLDYQHNMYEHKNGHVSASGCAQKLPGREFEPHFGSQGTLRFRRSPEPQGSIAVQRQALGGPDRRPAWNLDYQHNMYEHKNGHVSASGGAQKLPGREFEPHFGSQGTLRFRRSPEPQGSIAVQRQALGGPDRRPAWNLDYQHNMYEHKNGHVSASGCAQKLPGREFEPHFGSQGTLRFRRSPEPQGSIAVQRQALGGPDRRPAWNLDYQHNMYEHKNGHVSASGGAQKLPGREFEPHFGSQGTLRFRRSPEPQGSIAVQRQALGGPDRRPAWNLDYQHNMYEHKNGHVSASGCAQKLPGREFEPHFGSQGTLRFRRSPEPQGSIAVQRQALGGPDRRPAWNLDYQHNMYEGKNGHVSASGGAQKLPGREFEPHFGSQGTLRFRRSPEPQGSIAVQRQALGGPDRRPAWNLDYQHNIYEGKNGQISASGHAQNLPDREIEPHFGSQGTLRFRRSPEPQGSIAVQRQALGGPDRRPAWNLDYQHNMYEGKNGHISASGGAQKLPGREFEPHFGSQGTLRFRRSPEPQGSIAVQRQALGGPDRRPAWNLDYQHNMYEGKNGHISASGGAQKLPGREFEPHFGSHGTLRFRRSPEPQGSIVLRGDKPLEGPDRRPAWNVDYQHNIYEGKNGQITAGGGALKLPGRDFEPHFGVQGTWRF